MDALQLPALLLIQEDAVNEQEDAPLLVPYVSAAPLSLLGREVALKPSLHFF
jgi:hypothetical protein